MLCVRSLQMASRWDVDVAAWSEELGSRGVSRRGLFGDAGARAAVTWGVFAVQYDGD